MVMERRVALIIDGNHRDSLNLQLTVYADGHCDESYAKRRSFDILNDRGNMLNAGANNLMVAGKSRY